MHSKGSHEGRRSARTGDAGSVRETSESADGLPSGATPKEAAAVRRVRTISHLLDEAIRVPGTNFRIGLDPIVGILPIGGDAATAIVGLYPIVEAYRFGASRWTLARMLARVAVDAVIGSVPLLGNVFDAVWKANVWNCRTFERHLRDS